MTLPAAASAFIVAMWLISTSGYLIACVISPFGTCRRCGGTGRKGLIAVCRRCRGTGYRMRAGRRLINGFLDTRDRFTR